MTVNELIECLKSLDVGDKEVIISTECQYGMISGTISDISFGGIQNFLKQNRKGEQFGVVISSGEDKCIFQNIESYIDMVKEDQF